MEQAATTIQVIKQASDLIRTKKSSTIERIEKQPGFSSIEMSFQSAKFTKLKKDYFLNTYLQTFSNKIELPKDKHDDLKKELEASTYSDDGQGYFYHLFFSTGTGKYFAVAFYLKNYE